MHTPHSILWAAPSVVAGLRVCQMNALTTANRVFTSKKCYIEKHYANLACPHAGLTLPLYVFLIICYQVLIRQKSPYQQEGCISAPPRLPSKRERGGRAHHPSRLVRAAAGHISSVRHKTGSRALYTALLAPHVINFRFSYMMEHRC